MILVLVEVVDDLFPVDRPVGQPVRDGTARALTIVFAMLAIVLVGAYQALIHLPESWQQRLLGESSRSE